MELIVLLLGAIMWLLLGVLGIGLAMLGDVLEHGKWSPWYDVTWGDALEFAVTYSFFGPFSLLAGVIYIIVHMIRVSFRKIRG